jgi:phosphoribosylglycinamide formyltransferase-1
MLKANIAIFASGQGSNALNLIRYFESHNEIHVQFILSNKSDAKVLEDAQKLGVQTVSFSNSEVENGDFITQYCVSQQIDFIVLAGYLRKIPAALIAQFPNHIFNIHPALLPKFGGAGMYGKHVHEAVLLNKENETGITIHLVNEDFDAGEKIAQFHCDLAEDETVETIQQKVQALEQAYFPMVIEATILKARNV